MVYFSLETKITSDLLGVNLFITLLLGIKLFVLS